MKDKPRNKHKGDSATPEKMSTDDNRGAAAEGEQLNKQNELYSELKITEETLQQFKEKRSSLSESNKIIESVSVRKELPPEKRKLPTQKYFVLKKIPEGSGEFNQTEESLFEQSGIRMDGEGRVLEHSIVGSVEDFYRMALKKGKIRLEEVPIEYHFNLGYGEPRRPISAMFPMNAKNYRKKSEAVSADGGSSGGGGGNISRRSKSSRKIREDPDTSALKLWEMRMNERRSLQNHISKTVQRATEELIFNSGEAYRALNETNYIISKSIPYYGPGHGFRTGSEFWQQREEVGTDPDLSIHMTNSLSQIGFPPPIVHVGVPYKICEEKGVPSSVVDVVTKKGEYFAKRCNELSEVIQELDPHAPEIGELMVRGRNKQSIAEEIIQRREETLTSGKHEKKQLQGDRDNTIEDMAAVLNNVDSVALQIDNVPIMMQGNDVVDNDDAEKEEKEAEGTENALEVRKVFSGLERTNCTEKIKFQNKGQTILRLWWKKIDSYDPFNLENKNERKFYFSTQDIILLPNQEINFPIIFKSNQSGIYSEKWKLETSPILGGGREIVIVLKGVALLHDVTKTTRAQIQEYLHYQVAQKFSMEILDEILANVYHYASNAEAEDMEEDSYTEEEEFNCINKNVPYNADVLQNMRKIHAEYFGKDLSWDLNCWTIRKNLLSLTSIKTDKKTEACDKFYKVMDKMMPAAVRAHISRMDHLYRIGYRHLLEFGDHMFVALANLRVQCELPEMEVRVTGDKKRNNLSRQRTNLSQISKASTMKKPNVSSVKTKSRESTNLQESVGDTQISEEGTENALDEVAEIENAASQPQQQQSDNTSQLTTNKMQETYRYKSYQTVHALLNATIDQILDFWVDLNE